MGIASGRKFRWTRQLIFHHRYFWCLLPLLAILLTEIFRLSVMSLNFFHRILLSSLTANSKHIPLKNILTAYLITLKKFSELPQNRSYIMTSQTLAGQLQYKSFFILPILGTLLWDPILKLSYCIGMECHVHLHYWSILAYHNYSINIWSRSANNYTVRETLE